MKRPERTDLILILIWPILASALTIFFEEVNIFHENFFVSILIFLAAPSIYLSFRGKRYVPKAILAALIGSIPIMIIVEYFGHISQSWSFPPSIFPFSLFGMVIIETLFWAFFNVYFIIMFYEYFLDHHVTGRLWGPRMKYLLYGTIVVFIMFLIIILNFSVPPIPYFYLLFGIVVFALPVILQLSAYSHTKSVIIKMLKAAAYFFYLSFIYEILALNYGWWGFPTESFIGWFSLLGYRFPLEELIWWIILFALAVLSCYEYFDDDEK
ncbi:MAG: hypothetical protein ABH864_03015 [archaeon]